MNDSWLVGQLQGETSGYCYAKLSKDKVKEVRDKMPVLVSCSHFIQH